MGRRCSNRAPRAPLPMQHYGDGARSLLKEYAARVAERVQQEQPYGILVPNLHDTVVLISTNRQLGA